MTTLIQQAAFSGRVQQLLEQGRREADRCGQPVLVSATVAVPFLDPITLFDRARGQERALWEQPGEAFSLVGVGAAARLTGRGQSRFSQVAAAWRDLTSRAVIEAPDSWPVASPLCLGGFAFDPAPESNPRWPAYEDALLVVPRLLITSTAGSSWLTVNTIMTSGCDLLAAADAVAGALDGIPLGGNAATGHEGGAAEVALEDDAEADRWKETVRAVIQDIRRGAVEKVVLAREVRARSLEALNPGTVMRRLRAGYGGCTLFAFARGDACFLGATPERLVRLDGRLVRADCLAGSTARGATEDEDRSLAEALLADGKERHEHALVVRALRDALGPVCSQLRIPETPTILRMPNVQHLHSPVEGALKGEEHVLTLVERLHPTPAAGGLPRQAALSLIRSYEPFDRGWYAGPVGWIDGRGGGEFAVAIRSALLRGSEALLYAGCGIVAGSDPEREYEESCLKLRPMLWALNGKAT